MTEQENNIGVRPRLAYFTTAYPSVSHTFIRREILGLEALGYQIERLAVRAGQAVVDPVDFDEQKKTFCMFDQSLIANILQGLRGLFHAKLKFLRGIVESVQLHRNSERGLLRHIAYLLEALILVSCCKQKGIQHIHVHFGTNAAAVALLANTMSGISFSMTVHGPDELDAPIGFSLGKKMTRAAFTIAISNFGAAQLRRWLPDSQWHKIHVVRCSVDEQWFEAAMPVDSAANSIVCVGRLSAQKGQLLLLDAFEKVASEYNDLNLVLVGDGEMRDVVEQRLRDRGLEERVTITGWCTGEQVRKYLLKSRALVLSSFAEGLPVVIMEAMALKRPVIATSIMGIPELVRHGENGWLVISGDVDSLAEGIKELCVTDLSVLREMGEAGQRLVKEQHSATRIVKTLDQLFRQVLKKPK